ncbi:zinc transporter 1a [Paramormyrops kingsleyae]|uniref:Solute carrier family 30 member 1a n=1 Tax=Paramormyrops kingsleyae TaxID=1676925 RepID=A0A3B3QDH6_9TELE|nr:zinc transporter 1 [Paramormyrops kingsleyae]
MDCEPNRVRLMCMLGLTAGFFVAEVVVSRLTSSLAMLSDSFHMLSDVIALLVALVAVRFASRTQATSKNTFGWIRAEVMGALVNAVFLTALCFTIILEAVERFTEPHEIESPQIVIGVGAAGLLVNLLGLCMFHGHSGGGGHGHSHGGHSHGGRKGKRAKGCKADRPGGASGEETNLVGTCGSPNGVNADRAEVHRADSPDVQINGGTPYDELEQSQDSASQLNMRGVFLHVLGDALGSVIVVVNALIFTFVWKPCPKGEPCINPCTSSHCTDHQHINHTLVDLSGNSTGTVASAGPCWVLYLDPTLCIIMVGILLYTTYPLLKESALILLQTVPKQIDMHQLSERLQQLDGVLAVHELHIWQLAGSRIIATAHIKCHDPASYMEVAKRLKDFFHNEGIHATTIQPEFVTVNSESRTSLCELSCLTQCAPKLCCGAADKVGVEKRPENKPPVLEVISEAQESCNQDQPPSVSSIQVVARQEAEAVFSREVESSL